MKKEKSEGNLLGIGTAYVPVVEIKNEMYVKLEDFSNSVRGLKRELVNQRNAFDVYRKKFKSCLKDYKELVKDYVNLEEENKKLKEERIFSLGEYDYMILTSTTPQLKIIKKNQNYSLMEEDTLQELRDLGEI